MKFSHITFFAFFFVHATYAAGTSDLENINIAHETQVAKANIKVVSQFIDFQCQKVLEIGACRGFDGQEMQRLGADVFFADIEENYLTYLRDQQSVPEHRLFFGKIQTNDQRLKDELLEHHIDLDATGWTDHFEKMRNTPNLVDVVAEHLPFDSVTVFRVAFCEKEGAGQLATLVKNGGYLVIGYATEWEYEGRLKGSTFDILKQSFSLEHTLLRTDYYKDLSSEDAIYPDNAVWMIWKKK